MKDRWESGGRRGEGGVYPGLREVPWLRGSSVVVFGDSALVKVSWECDRG